jgi:hypothetical protein
LGHLSLCAHLPFLGPRYRRPTSDQPPKYKQKKGPEPLELRLRVREEAPARQAPLRKAAVADRSTL